MHPDGWTPAGFEAQWEAKMHGVADTLFGRHKQMAAERGTFVSFEEVVKLVAVERAVQRLRAAA